MTQFPDFKNVHVAVVGLGYVGLPLAVAFGEKFKTFGFDISKKRIEELKTGYDHTQEISKEEFAAAKHLEVTYDTALLKSVDMWVVTVPTPIDECKRPDLTPLMSASKTVGSVMKKGAVVVFESTVYPGATEEVCVPILEKQSGLKLNQDFCVGYSPERINPGDKVHRLPNILKVTSGSTEESSVWIDSMYKAIIPAGTYRAKSIKVAEAAKVIENTQRDLNIALINELALIFKKLNIDTLDVLEAAGTKWNFLPFRPGLVGGHCIGVDPYYLTHKAQEVGYHPEVILAGRRINDGMGAYVADEVIKLMSRNGISCVNAPILIMGLTFKENCPDLRNTRVIDLVSQLNQYHAQVDIFDPWIDPEEAKIEYDLEIQTEWPTKKYAAIILAVAHDVFVKAGVNKIRALGATKNVLYDIKSVLPRTEVDGRL
ncbi:MAG: Vi polysaccharide biosynthesis UDP-N-acetylglucosamine C-6 dehydrogenase TviB [Pseudomonadota bacterium]